MFVPNLLNVALSIIPKVKIQWAKTTGRTQNALGQWITEYAEPVALWCSFQPIEKAKYEQMGLDMNKHYFVLYGSQDLTAVERGTAGDVFIHNGLKYQAEDAVDWFSYNGWKAIVVVEIGASDD